MSKLINLKNFVCLVTGGASGLGRSTVEMLLGSGARTIIADLPPTSPRSAADIVAQITARSPAASANCHFLPVDVSSEKEASSTIAEVSRRFGRLDVLVNCAGIAITKTTYNPKSDEAHSYEVFEKIVRVNLLGTFNMARLAAQLIARNSPDEHGLRGIIVNTASVAAFDAGRGMAAYAASKGGVVSMALPMARDLAPLGIRVVTIAPGIIETPMSKNLTDEARARESKRIPLPARFGQPDEFAHAVRTAIENPYMNACVMRMDGAYISALVH